jgi:hypothetical protein
MDSQTNTEVEKRRSYMREYKRRKYAEDPEKILAKNRAYYCKATRNVPETDFKRYDIMLPVIARVRDGMEVLKQNNPEMLQEIINYYK